MLKLNNVLLKFGGLIAVNDLTFEVKKNSVFGLIGPNGAGKTTVFNIISGVYSPNSGNIEYKGDNITGLHSYQVNKIGIARTYQNINIFNNMTVLKNVMVGCHSVSKSGVLSSILGTKKQRKEEEEIKRKSLDLINFIGLSGKEYLTAKNLAYGEQKLLEIARALASEPEIILLDEPAAGMNTKEKEDLKKQITNIQKRGVTILIIEHDMKLLMGVTDTICVLNYGKKIALGNPKYIQNHPDVIEAYLGGE